jgi:hypothetical protein
MRYPATTLCLALLGLLLAGPALAQPEVVVSADIDQNTTWTANNTYVLNGLIFVQNGADLTIEPGTVIKARAQENITSGDGASALIIERGSRIFAEGAAEAPIIFTSEFDDFGNLTQRDRELWGGLIILGRATTNQPTQDNAIEGIPEAEGALYGGTDDDDDSGVLRYVSIRHGGFSISGVEGDEINGLTMGGVGRGTTIEYIEVYANFDDCFEWFGGTVDAKYLVGAFCGDDSYDYDQGWRGRGQFWFTIQDDDVAGRGGEHDGGDAAGDDAEPLSRPVISNVTYIGSGQTATVPGGDNNDRALYFRDAAAGFYFNSIFTDFANVALNIEDLDGDAVDSRTRLEQGDLGLFDNLFFGFGAGSTIADIVDGTFADATIAATNAYANPQLGGVCRTQGACLDPRPAPSGPAASGAQFTNPELDDWFDVVSFRGAFAPNGPVWATGWTALDREGFLSGAATPSESGASVTGFGLRAVYPNPARGTATVTFELDRAQAATVAVYDLLGREVAVLARGEQPAGRTTVTLDAAALPAGLYIVHLAGETATATQKVVVVR